MNSNYSLETTRRDVLQVVHPTADDWAKRCHVISNLRAIVESVEVFKGATVQPFGSFVSNHFTRWGDLDISISSAGEKYDNNFLLAVIKAMKTIGGFDVIDYISEARVPIVKCVSTKDKISCHISLNNLSSRMKSKMLYWINEIDGRFRDLVLIVKEWAKAQSINDPKTGTLNSYSLSLLFLFHFQTCDPPILPPLYVFYPWNMTANYTGERAIAKKHIKLICSMNIDKFKANTSRILNLSSLSDLFISFLAKFRNISARGQHQRISPQNGKWEDIVHTPPCALFIEDPFEQPTNWARAVRPKQILVIEQAFEKTYKQLTSANLQNPLSVLVRPEVMTNIYTSQAGSSSGILWMNPPTMNQQAHTNKKKLIIEDENSCKSILVELGVKLKLGLPKYNLAKVDYSKGPHSPLFLSSVVFDNVSYLGDFAKTKKKSEQAAARAVILKILDSEQGQKVAKIVNTKLMQFE